MARKITIALIIIIWPLSLFLNNTFTNFLSYVVPIFQVKFALLPLLLILLNYQRKYFKIFLVALILLLIFFKPFFGQTVFKSDYEANQKVLQEQKLYPSIILARLFQNKARVPLDKITNNFFALTDPNNYFFGFAPRQITLDNQNLKKFPFLSLPFFLIGLYYIFKSSITKHHRLITFLIASLINLSILTNFDRNDFILWIPLSLIVIKGLNIFDTKFKYSKYYYWIFIVFSSIEIIRLFIMK